jgi:hypothetical protein
MNRMKRWKRSRRHERERDGARAAWSIRAKTMLYASARASLRLRPGNLGVRLPAALLSAHRPRPPSHRLGPYLRLFPTPESEYSPAPTLNVSPAATDASSKFQQSQAGLCGRGTDLRGMEEGLALWLDLW